MTSITLNIAVDTLPLRGEGSRVGGRLAPTQHCGSAHPHPTSPVKGEELFGVCGVSVQRGELCS
ncbi:MAG: hypothetical protein JWR51_3778 [Devosia sp.]|nr:hypothetical protein [Devosia sp.]